ncbi:DMT family transporter [Demequina sp.]|uniref:DMT family transporter n=1 Tax=Demequina sp. TaxID=2050685 RepID=UPI0025BEB4C8|nr:DMT family transporter [Demequina sp.]
MPSDQFRSPVRGAFYALLAAALFGLNGSASKVVIAAGLNPAQVTFMRVLATAVLSGAWLAVAGRRHFAVTRRELAALALLGVGGLAMVQWFYSVAISLLPVGVALLFEYTAVILVALTAWLAFGERIGARLWWAIGAVLVGLAVVAQVWDSTLRPLGVLAGLGAAVAFAFYFLAGERGVANKHPFAVAFWASAFASAFWALFSGWWNIDPELLTHPVSLTGALESVVVPLLVPLAYILTLGSFAPFVLLFTALRHTSATAVGVAASSEVLFAFAVAWVWLGESLSVLQVVGSIVVFAGIVLAQTARQSPTAALEPPAVGEAAPPPL